MPRTIRFHLDEGCNPRIAAGLQQRGVTVTTTAAAGLSGASDQDQLAYALAHGRVIVTHDADFLRLHAAGARHAGIIYSSSQHRSLGDVIRLLVLVWELVESAEMIDRVEFL